MENSHKKAQKIDEKSLRKRMSRRTFFKESGKSIGAAALTGTASFYGLDFVAGRVNNIMQDAEREIRKLALDVKALSGSLERKLAEETKQLEQHYTKGRLKIYEDLGIATPAELQEFEKIIKTSEEFEAYYNFAERAKEFKDRVDRRLLSLDEKLESYQPGFMKGINDKIRQAFGKPYGEEGKRTRTAIRERLETLCRIYDTNEDNKKAEVQVLKKLNEYIEKTPDITPEEKELLEFLRDQYKRGDRSKELKEFIRNYQNYGERNESLIKLRNSLTQAEALYGRIKENKQYITRLQDLLKQGISLQEKARAQAPREFEVHKQEIDKKVKTLTDSVDNVILELKRKGYPIETREDYSSKGTFSKAMGNIIKPLVYMGTAAASLLAGGLTAYTGFKTRKIKTAKATLRHVIKEHDSLAEKYNGLLEDNQGLESEIEKYKNHDMPEYNEGAGI